MAVKFMKGDAVKLAFNDKHGAVMHVCNNKGSMGSGIAKQIKHVFPEAYEAYRNGGMELGTMSAPLNNKVINLISQDSCNGYNKKYDNNKRYINYGALCSSIYCFFAEYDFEWQDAGIKNIYIPMLMGADRAGGDWDTVLEIVDFAFRDSAFNIIVVEFDKGNK